MKIYQVDAFCEEAFKGNPAGVVLLKAAVSVEFMQNIAMEMNLSETAFVIAQEKGFGIRYFTPTREVPLCGHATLASAHLLYELGVVEIAEKISFKAQEVTLEVRKDGDWIRMIFPQYPIEKIAIPENFKDIIGFSPIAMYRSADQWRIAIANDQEQITEAKPNFSIMESHDLGHLMITAKSALDAYDFVVRCFAPMSGIDEDPVTGSAHCALIPLWAQRLDKTVMISLQCSKRTGILEVELMDEHVVIKGKAITIFEVDLKVIPVKM